MLLSTVKAEGRRGALCVPGGVPALFEYFVPNSPPAPREISSNPFTFLTCISAPQLSGQTGTRVEVVQFYLRARNGSEAETGTRVEVVQFYLRARDGSEAGAIVTRGCRVSKVFSSCIYLWTARPQRIIDQLQRGVDLKSNTILQACHSDFHPSYIAAGRAPHHTSNSHSGGQQI
eukprot:SAG31_NODE_3556_length_4126_cov_1.701266_2_plen_175_part_00